MSIKPSNRIQQVEEYYFSKKLAEIRGLRQNGKEIINLGIGNPDLPAHPDVLTTLAISSKEKGSNYYQSYRGLPELRKAFAEWYLSTYNVSLNSNSEILPLMGSKEGIMHITMAFTNPGDQVLIPNPGYPTYTSVSKLLNLDIQNYNLKEENNWLPDISEIDKIIKPTCKIIWMNFPNMPTGAKIDKNNISQLIDYAKKKNILLVNDNPYSLILNDQPTSFLGISKYENHILELNSLSKSHNMAGWRIGIVAGSEENINYILKVKSNFDSGMFKPIQEAAITALKLPNDWINDLNKKYKIRREIIWKILDQLQCEYSKKTSGMFVWAKIPSDFVSGKEFSDYLLYNHSIFITPGFIFGSNGEKHIRISLCENKSTLNKVLKLITNLKKKRA